MRTMSEQAAFHSTHRTGPPIGWPTLYASVRLHGHRQSAVTQVAEDLQHFAAGGRSPTAGPLVGVHGVHELDFIIGVVAFARGRVDLASAVDLGATFELARLDGGDGWSLRPARPVHGDRAERGCLSWISPPLVSLSLRWRRIQDRDRSRCDTGGSSRKWPGVERLEKMRGFSEPAGFIPMLGTANFRLRRRKSAVPDVCAGHRDCAGETVGRVGHPSRNSVGLLSRELRAPLAPIVGATP